MFSNILIVLKILKKIYNAQKKVKELKSKSRSIIYKAFMTLTVTANSLLLIIVIRKAVSCCRLKASDIQNK